MQRLSLLYVDDDPDIREVAVLSLELDSQIEARVADGGAACLAVLDGGYRPDAILLDVMMPEMDGPATLKQIRGRPGFEKTPVIFITARALKEEQERFLALGAQGVITKPFDPMSLARQVRAVLASA